jgi:hypothetical protein
MSLTALTGWSCNDRQCVLSEVETEFLSYYFDELGLQ